ncbi:MAG TPA: ABC transporter permease [Blastocatellia bacterium]|nr:ABC transporter permease [Blastocatellia bacterium]
MQSFWQDLRYGARMLLKNPGFTLIAVLTLALGIGANTAIFSVINGVLLSALPYPQPEQLAMVWCDNRRQGIPDDITSYPNFVDWRDRNKTFQGMAGMTSGTVHLTGVGEPEEIRAATVSINFFQVIDVAPRLGRGFTAEEERPGSDRVVILSHALWQRRFGGDPGILNKTVSLSGISNTVVGIMPPGFQFPENTDMWRPLAPNDGLRSARFGFFLPVVGRIKPGVTRAQAQADLDVIANQIEQQFPDMAGYGVNVVPVLEQTVGAIRRTLMILFLAVILVLLIACANVANLLLARAAGRRREVALRAALGAGRWRIVRQLLTENMLLAALGGALGVLLAWWGLRLLVDLSPANIPRLENIRLDGRVLWFTLGLSLLTGLIFGLAPALQTTQLKLSETLNEGGRSGSGGRSARLIRGVLVVVEVALTLVLLVGAGLLIRSFWRLQQVDPGFKTDNVLTLRLSLPRSRYTDGAQAASFFDRLQERLAALPGVVSVSSTTDIMLQRLATSSSFTIENRPPDPSEMSLELPFDRVQPNYFQTMGIQLLRGRTFTAQDGRDSPRVAIVNETFVKRYFPNEDPIGKRFTFGGGGPNAQWIAIVGVVRDTKRQGVDQPIRIESWMPLAQSPARSMEVVLRTTGDPLALGNAAREAVWSIDRDLPIPRMQTLEQNLSARVAQRRLNMLLLGLFASVALVLAAVGIYGVMNYTVTQRTNEIGIRMALGAQTRDVLRLVVGEGMILALLGVVIGLVMTFAFTRLMASLLFGVSASDPLTFAVIAALLFGVALLACWIPARRATDVDPMVALRYE